MIIYIESEHALIDASVIKVRTIEAGALKVFDDGSKVKHQVIAIVGTPASEADHQSSSFVLWEYKEEELEKARFAVRDLMRNFKSIIIK